MRKCTPESEICARRHQHQVVRAGGDRADEGEPHQRHKKVSCHDLLMGYCVVKGNPKVAARKKITATQGRLRRRLFVRSGRTGEGSDQIRLWQAPHYREEACGAYVPDQKGGVARYFVFPKTAMPGGGGIAVLVLDVRLREEVQRAIITRAVSKGRKRQSRVISDVLSVGSLVGDPTDIGAPQAEVGQVAA